MFIGKTNGSSCKKSRPKPLIQPQSSTRATPCAMPCGRLGLLWQRERDQVFIGKTNGSSCRKSRPKPLIQPHSRQKARGGSTFKNASGPCLDWSRFGVPVRKQGVAQLSRMRVGLYGASCDVYGRHNIGRHVCRVGF